MVRMIILRVIEKIRAHRTRRAIREGNQTWLAEQQAMYRNRRG